MKQNSLKGKRFGRLVVISQGLKPVHITRRGRWWNCLCDCGNSLVVRGDCLISGNTSSCGCLYQETRNGMHKHGHCSDWTITAEYRTWIAIKQRCFNPKNAGYNYYGGSGIVMCKEWAENFEVFFKYMGAKPSTKHSIDRLDNTKGYEPGNVRWATPKEQYANRRAWGTVKNSHQRTEEQ